MLSLPTVDGPLVYVMICVVLTLVFQWWYRSRKLDIRYEDSYVLIAGCDTGMIKVDMNIQHQIAMSFFDNFFLTLGELKSIITCEDVIINFHPPYLLFLNTTIFTNFANIVVVIIMVVFFFCHYYHYHPGH